MDEKKKTGFVNAARKLLAMDTSEDEIVMSMQELGMSEQDARQILRELQDSSPRHEEKNLTPKDLLDKQIETHKKKYEDKKEVFKKEKKEAVIKKSVQEQVQIFKKSSENFIPNLRKGGLEKVKEIVVDSPIGKRDKLDRIHDTQKQGDVIDKLARMEQKLEQLQKKVGKKKGKKQSKK